MYFENGPQEVRIEESGMRVLLANEIQRDLSRSLRGASESQILTAWELSRLGQSYMGTLVDWPLLTLRALGSRRF